jgi:tRNA G10  N-methylase Trm11
MARVAAPGAGDLVWDPHCGCGAELLECARLAPGLQLLGTDTDPRAIAAARTNVAAAGLAGQIRLERIDALAGSPAPGTVAAIVTNPPMGRRAGTSEGVHDYLCAFVRQAATVLRPGGRLVWVTPAPRVTAAAGDSAGLVVHDHGPIDMSGFRVVLQVMRRE